MTSALLSKLQRWAYLSDEDARLIKTLPGEHLTLARGDHPLTPADHEECSLLVTEGWAAEYKDTPSGRRVIVAFLLPGDFAMTTPGHDTSLRTVMLSPGSVLLVPRASMRQLLARDPIRRGLEWAAAIRESVMAEWLVNIASRKAHARLAHLLCELSIRMNSIDLLDHDVCDMPLTQIDLANALAMTNVHLNVALQRLRAAKLVDVSARHLTILCRPQLEAIAEFDDEYLLRWPTELPDRRQANMRWADSERRSRPPRHL